MVSYVLALVLGTRGHQSRMLELSILAFDIFDCEYGYDDRKNDEQDTAEDYIDERMGIACHTSFGTVISAHTLKHRRIIHLLIFCKTSDKQRH
jgi:hypothetical protein